MNQEFTPTELEGKQICFLLDVDYNGRIFRFSSFPIELIDESNGQVIPYNGGLSDPEIEQKTSFLGVQIEGNTVSVELYFHDIDWVEEWKSGRVLDNSRASISMISHIEGKTGFTIQERIGLFQGVIIDSIFGDPEKPSGYITFSIENSIMTVATQLLTDDAVLDFYSFPNLEEKAQGKIAPFVFGNPSPYYVGYVDELTPQNGIVATPVYDVEKLSLTGKYLIAYHPVLAENARIYDSTGGNFVNPVETDIDVFGNIFSYVQYNVAGPNIEDNSFVPVSDDDKEFWCQWSEWEGGIANPYGSGTLTKGGDLCLWAMDASGLDYDYDEWVGLLPILNQYIFAGYVNDLEITIWEWIQENVIAYLPIEIINGGAGLKPVLNLYFYSQRIHPKFHMEDNGEFEIITAIQPLETDIVNFLTIRFGWEGRLGRFRSTFRIQGNLATNQQTSIRTKTPLAEDSFYKYGLRQKTIELPFVYDFWTAQRIARDIIRISAMGAYGIEVAAAPRYGYIQVGDIISLSSSRIGLLDHKCQVIGKTWNGNRWRFVIYLEDNKLINN